MLTNRINFNHSQSNHLTTILYIVELCWFALIFVFIPSIALGSDGHDLKRYQGGKPKHGWQIQNKESSISFRLRKDGRHKRYGGKISIGSPYLEVGAGYGIWYKAQQPKMANYQSPMEVFVEYGHLGNPISYQLGANFNTAFVQEIFVLKPKVIFAGAKYTLPNISNQAPFRIHPYTTAGITGWQTNLTDRVYPGIISYEFKTEKDKGVGAYAGAGVSFKYKQWSLSPQFTYYLSGIGQYLAGAFEKQDINTGYMSATVRLAYRFRFGTNKIACPSYN
ncbi:hypothetical protein QQ008_22285 [Fulvivirgaceae bacterium BMA10]|uniref:Outer membrane protein beta-barrel domain-containing protein n=1 Tax=Splendidivirga corallicola TaxID=3051826 RepID=A0ABT8KWZ0_9BACT|nr:hypothetical protein [Fulvivirgaceae bacterium BMA10]